MGFAVNVPNANQSPGLFPGQCNTNFQRIFDVVNADHFFSTTTSTTQGFHKQVTLVNRTAPGSLPAGASAIFFSNFSADTGQNELFMYNGVSTTAITGGLGQPIRVVGIDTFIGNETKTVFNPPYNWAGTAHVLYNNTINYSMYSLARSSTSGIANLVAFNGSSPGINFSGTAARVHNTLLTPQTIVWSFIINRL